VELNYAGQASKLVDFIKLEVPFVYFETNLSSSKSAQTNLTLFSQLSC